MQNRIAVKGRQRFRAGRKGMLLSVLTNTLLAIIKIVSGVVGHTYALVADGIESLLDIFSSLVVLGGLRISAIPPDKNHPYGHGKAEGLSALAVAVILLAAAIGVATQSLREILAPQKSPAPFTLAVLLAVILTKELLYRFIMKSGDAIDSTAMKTDAWHQRSDALTSVAAFIGISIALLGGPAYASADDWAALFACGIIAYNGVHLLRNAVMEVMDTAPASDFETRVRAISAAVDGVEAIDKCLVRKSGFGYFVDLHVEVDGGLSVRQGHKIGHDVKDALLVSDLPILDVLVHVEPFGGAVEA